jgi:Zn-dependent oligopeptidase
MKVDLDKYENKSKKLINNVISDCICEIMKIYRIMDGDNVISDIEKVKQSIMKTDNTVQCMGMTSKNERCTRHTTNVFCKMHYNKYNITNPLYNKITIDEEIYYEKEEFIYTLLDNEYIKCGKKVGDEFRITTDPFELEML